MNIINATEKYNPTKAAKSLNILKEYNPNLPSRKVLGKDPVKYYKKPKLHGRHQTAKMEKVLETLTQAVRIYSQDKGMEFGKKEKKECAMLILKSEKR